MSKKPITPLTEQLITARKQAGLSQRKTAQLAGVSYPWICEIETGKGNPTAAFLAKLARIYGTTFTIGPDDEQDVKQ